MSLGSARQEDETYPQHFYPETEGTPVTSSYIRNMESKCQNAKPALIAFWAFNKHRMAKEISKHVQTLMTPER